MLLPLTSGNFTNRVLLDDSRAPKHINNFSYKFLICPAQVPNIDTQGFTVNTAPGLSVRELKLVNGTRFKLPGTKTPQFV